MLTQQRINDVVGAALREDAPNGDGWYFEKNSKNGSPAFVFRNGLPTMPLPKCPYGQPGDRLWVRETWQGYRMTSYEYDEWEAMESPKDRNDDHYSPVYKADGKNFPEKWFPSIFMPREFSRIDLLIKDIRVERLQDISEADAIAEGCRPQFDKSNPVTMNGIQMMPHISAKEDFQRLWDSINGKKHPWESNPWVWVINFERIKL